jgi:hypothetical protein
MKCIPIKVKYGRYRVICEWFLLKIASELNLAPKILQPCGFDLLMFDSCIEFAMEVCTEITFDN